MIEFRHNNSDMTLPMISMIHGFWRSRNAPCYIRSDPRSVSDIDTLRSSQNDAQPGTLFVMDRGFIDDDNFETMDTSGLYLITPLIKNSRIIHYSCDTENFFMFRKRAIRYLVKRTRRYDCKVFLNSGQFTKRIMRRSPPFHLTFVLSYFLPHLTFVLSRSWNPLS